MLHVACFIAKSVRFMTALDVGGPGVCGDGAPAVLRSGGLEAEGRCGETMRGPGMLQQRDADACGGLGDACGDFEEARAPGQAFFGLCRFGQIKLFRFPAALDDAAEFWRLFFVDHPLVTPSRGGGIVCLDLRRPTSGFQETTGNGRRPDRRLAVSLRSTERTSVGLRPGFVRKTARMAWAQPGRVPGIPGGFSGLRATRGRTARAPNQFVMIKAVDNSLLRHSPHCSVASIA